MESIFGFQYKWKGIRAETEKQPQKHINVIKWCERRSMVFYGFTLRDHFRVGDDLNMNILIDHQSTTMDLPPLIAAFYISYNFVLIRLILEQFGSGWSSRMNLLFVYVVVCDFIFKCGYIREGDDSWQI